MQLAIDFTECHVPQTKEELERLLIECAEKIGATIVQSVFHEFSPYGLSGVLVIAESHIAAHTYPEHNTVQIDIFTCGEMNCEKAVIVLQEALGGRMHYQEIHRVLGDQEAELKKLRAEEQALLKKLSKTLEKINKLTPQPVQKNTPKTTEKPFRRFQGSG